MSHESTTAEGSPTPERTRPPNLLLPHLLLTEERESWEEAWLFLLHPAPCQPHDQRLTGIPDVRPAPTQPQSGPHLGPQDERPGWG